ncbi:MAG: hypothetical protein EOP52_12420 [Sphingobacteriales bacterium]|nr:MAG: hypothetical protein EOP52_12420 [Sphingobacteriales bacterium]
MPAISKPIPTALLRKLRRKGKPLGGKAELSEMTGITQPGIALILKNGRALPATIEKLKKVLDTKNPAA